MSKTVFTVEITDIMCAERDRSYCRLNVLIFTILLIITLTFSFAKFFKIITDGRYFKYSFANY